MNQNQKKTKTTNQHKRKKKLQIGLNEKDKPTCIFADEVAITKMNSQLGIIKVEFFCPIINKSEHSKY